MASYKIEVEVSDTKDEEYAEEAMKKDLEYLLAAYDLEVKTTTITKIQNQKLGENK